MLSRTATSAIVTQHGMAKLGPTNVPYRTEATIALKEPVSLKFTQTKGNMRQLESSFSLDRQGTSTRLRYHLELVPSALAGVVISKELLQHEVIEQLNSTVAEMIRRAHKA